MNQFADECEKLFGTTECIRILKAELTADRAPDPESRAILDVLREAFPSILGGPSEKRATVGPGSKAFVGWLRRRKLPEVLVAHFTRCSFRGNNIVVGTADLACETDMIEDNGDNAYLIPSGFLQIGGALNGYPIVMDFHGQPFQVGYLSHEAVWSPDPPPARDHFVVVATKYSEFLRGCAERALPADYYEARGK